MTDLRRQWIIPSLALATLAMASAATLLLTRSFPSGIFLDLFVRQDFAGAILYGLMVLLVMIFYHRNPSLEIDRLVDFVDRYALRLAVVLVSILAMASLKIYHNHPLAMDEYSQVFQAKIFAAGEIWAEYPKDLLYRLIPKPFVGPFFEAESGRVVSRYWPGFALLLAPFMALGVPWLLNPVLAVASLLLLRHLARRLLPGTRAPGWAMLLAIASPQFTACAISYYAMTAHLFLNLLFVVLMLENSTLRRFLAGVVGSLALVLHQPLPHFLFALPWLIDGIFGLSAASRSQSFQLRTRRLLPVLLGYLPLTLILGFGWYALQGELQLSPSVAAQSSAAVGLPADELSQEGKGVLQIAGGFMSRVGQVLGITNPSLHALSYRYIEYLKLFLWAVPGLPFLAFLGFRRQEKSLSTPASHASASPHPTSPWRLLALSALVSLLGFFLVPFSQGHGWGYRYFHQAWGVLPLLAAAVLVDSNIHQRWLRAIGFAALLSLTLGTGLRFYQIHHFMAAQLSQLPPLEEGAQQVCFVEPYEGYYKADLIQNDPFLRDPVVFFVSYGKQLDEQLIRQRFPTAQKVYEKGMDTVWTVPSPTDTEGQTLP